MNGLILLPLWFMFWIDKVLITFWSKLVIFDLHPERFIFGVGEHVFQETFPKAVLQLFKGLLSRLLNPVFPKILEYECTFFNFRSHYVLFEHCIFFVNRIRKQRTCPISVCLTLWLHRVQAKEIMWACLR